MPRAPRFTPFVILAIAVSGCPEPFQASTGGTTESSSTGGSTGGASSMGGVAGGGSDSTGGTGGIPCDDADLDGDGYSECTHDCDDDNAFIHPGALEICGDGADEDCDGKDNLGEECNGFSTYVSPLGFPGATGTKDDPVPTIKEGVEHALLLGVPAAVLVAEGTYSEDITVTGPVSLIGGYAIDDWAVRDPANKKSFIKSTATSGLKLAAVDGDMLVDGFTIYGRQVSSGSESSAAVTIDGGGPVISHCAINAGQITMGSGNSVGVRIVEDSAAGVHARLWSSTILSGSAVTGDACGIEIDAPTMDVTIADCGVSAAKGADSLALHIVDAATVTVWKSTFQSTTASGGGINQPSSSFGVWALSGELIFDSNIVNSDQVIDPPRCFTPAAWCGGVRISTGLATLTNNVILGSASDHSAAVHLLETTDDLSEVVVSSNTLYAAGHLDFETTSACALLGSPRPDQVVTAVGRFRNNILYGGFATHNYGVWEQRTPGESCDPAALDHDLFYFPVNMPNDGVLYTDWNGIAATDIQNPDDLPGDGANLVDDPKLDGGHLREDSPCRNTGTDADAPNHDGDQQPRPQESLYDIGPDEYAP